MIEMAPHQLVDYIVGHMLAHFDPSTDLSLGVKFVKVLTPRYSVPRWPHQLIALPVILSL